MASILTNVSAMAALQTLRSIGNDMETTQGRISSGMRVGTASDNAAYWSIATTMRSDNAALSSVQDAMGLGAAKVDTAYAGMEAAIDVVTEIKNKLITAQESSADKSKIQEEITQLQDQLKSIASSASFSGENWLQTDIGGEANDTGEIVAGNEQLKQVVGSFTRDSTGNVTVKTVNVTLNESNVLFDLSGNNAGILDANVSNGFRQVKDASGEDVWAAIVVDAEPTDGGSLKDLGGNVFQKINADGTADDDAIYIKTGGAYVDAVYDDTSKSYVAETPVTADVTFASGVSVSNLDITKVSDYRTDLGMTNASDEDVISALVSFVDQQLSTMTSAAAKLGAMSSRIEMQTDFVSKLSDTLDAGVGRLVDADMNEESTKLKALQTQQQLAIQALSIANSDSQNILSLFR